MVLEELNPCFSMKATPLLVYLAGAVVTASSLSATNDLESAILSFPKLTASEYRPDVAVASVNALISAGENEKICHLCRLVFTPTNASEPLRPPRLGASPLLPCYSMTPDNWPDLPFAVVSGVPLSLNPGYGLAGVAEKAE